MESLYPFIYKRKSFHLFRNNKTKEMYKDKYHITNEEINGIYKVFRTFKNLVDDIKVEIKIVKEEETNCRRGAQYCVLFYSEKKDNYLQNIGFIGEQLDLYLVGKDIGTLWYGVGRTNELIKNDLVFVTMMGICKVPSDLFRKDMFKSKRKNVVEIWEGTNHLDIANIVRFAPSSCNTQPWFVKDNDNKMEIYRYKKPGKRGIMPLDKVVYQNLIDIGIFIYFINLCLINSNINFNLTIYDDNDLKNNNELTINAIIEILD